jgi:alkylated DNA repair dioxygenase AlkB
MTDLFDSHGPRRLEMPGADVTLHPRPDLGASPDDLFRRLRAETDWQQRSIRIQGREIPQPRLVAWHGDGSYTYSGLTLQAAAWSPTLLAIRERVEALTGATFNACLLNLYRDGRDSIGMHSDDEPEFGHEPTIASVSLGAERVFDFSKKDGTSAPVHVPLGHGSLVVMAGATQRNWKHGIAKTRERVGERINLTFRLLKPRR